MFIPDDINEAIQNGTLDHNGSGSYGTYGSGPFNLAVDLLSDPCRWRVRSTTVTLDDYELDEEFSISGRDSCEFADPISIDGVTHGGEVGTLEISVRQRRVIPLATENGCAHRLCGNCSCVPECLCIRYTTTFAGEHPTEGLSSYRVVRACWDEELGGWSAEFEARACSPALTAVVQLVRDDETGDCGLVMTGGPFEDEPSSIELDCEEFEGQWSWDGIEDEIDPYQPTGTAVVHVSEADCEGCIVDSCCSDLPDELTATVLAYAPPMPGPMGPGSPTFCAEYEFPLYRVRCASNRYVGSTTVSNCPATGGTGTLTMEFQCGGCVATPDGCECPCEGDEDPATDGCHTINSASIQENGGAYSSSLPSPRNSFCGVQSHPGTYDGFAFSSCDPLYAEFMVGLTPSVPFSCCDFYVIVTE